MYKYKYIIIIIYLLLKINKVHLFYRSKNMNVHYVDHMTSLPVSEYYMYNSNASFSISFS